MKGFISIFKLTNSTPVISAKDMNMILFGGLRQFNTLSTFENFDPAVIGCFYSDQIKTLDIFNYSDILIFDGNPEDYLIYDEKYFIDPFKELRNYDPSRLWSKTTINSINFRTLLSQRNIKDKFQFDYDKGIILTWGNTILDESFSLKNEDLYSYFYFHLPWIFWGPITNYCSYYIY